MNEMRLPTLAAAIGLRTPRVKLKTGPLAVSVAPSTAEDPAGRGVLAALL